MIRPFVSPAARRRPCAPSPRAPAAPRRWRVFAVLIATWAAAFGPPAARAASAAGRAIFELVRGTEPVGSDSPNESAELARVPQPAYIVVAAAEHKGVQQAARDLQRDITKIAGVTPNIVHALPGASSRCVVIGTADSAEGKALLASVGVGVDDIAGQWEVFKYRVLNQVGGKAQVLAIAGSNPRGTIFGVYDFEQKHLGVDPLWFWADHEPATRGELVFDSSIDFGPSQEPTWKYRGWTLNDHPQLMEWMQSGLLERSRYARYMFALHPEVIARFCEAALRLKMNMFTWYFIDIDWQPDRENVRAVVDRGLFITQHQSEGLGADTGYWETYWKLYHPGEKVPPLSYRQNPDALREFWTFYIKRWAEFSPQVVWEVNQRGWADGPYTEPSLPEGGTPQQRAEIISQALAEQARIVRELDPNPHLQRMTTLYAELGTAYDNGWLQVPEGVTTGFADRGMSGMAYSQRFWNEPRNPTRTYGQYFHTQYFGGGPQIAKCTPIETYLKVNLDAMYQRGDTRHMLLAINELRLQQLEIRAVAEMLWDYPSFNPREYLQRFSREQFGPEAGPQASALYDLYYEKFPHRMVTDDFKTYASYYKVMEPLFTVIGNLLNIENGSRDGKALRYDYRRDVYERGIEQMGEVLARANALQAAVPADRRGFVEYEFIAPSHLVRGIYKLSIATQDAIAHLANHQPAAALDALLEAKPFVEAINAAFKSETSGEKWQHWFRSSTNKDFYLLYNLYQKARLSLEVQTMNPVSVIEPARRPYRGNVVMHDPVKVGDPLYGAQPERINPTVFNGSRWSLTKFPLANAFQVAGVETNSGKGDWLEIGATDHGRAYTLALRSPATVYVAIEKGTAPSWLAEQGFKPTGATLEAGYWGWPYRWQNRPPTLVKTMDLFARAFPPGEVHLGKNPASRSRLPYVVFVQPALLLFENFRPERFDAAPSQWQTTGMTRVVDIPDYDAELRPSTFDLSTVPRYTPLDLRGLRLEATGTAQPSTAIRELSAPAEGDFTWDVRLQLGQADERSEIRLTGDASQPVVTIAFEAGGHVRAQIAGGADIAVGTYAPKRWYNVKVRVSRRGAKTEVVLQDDRLHEQAADVAEAPRSRVTHVALRHGDGGRGTGGWVLYNAMSLYRTDDSAPAAARQ